MVRGCEGGRPILSGHVSRVGNLACRARHRNPERRGRAEARAVACRRHQGPRCRLSESDRLHIVRCLSALFLPPALVTTSEPRTRSVGSGKPAAALTSREKGHGLGFHPGWAAWDLVRAGAAFPGQTGFAALIIDASAPPEQESLLYHYQNHAMQWDVSRIKGQLEALFGIGSDAVSQVCLRILPVVCESFAQESSS